MTFSSGNNISTMADQSGAGNTMTWGAVVRPVYQATGFNSTYPAVNNDGHASGSMLSISPFAMGTGATLTAWFVGTHTGYTGLGSGDGRMLSYIASGQSADFNNVGSWAFARPGTSNILAQFARNSTGSNATTVLTSPKRYIWTVNSSGDPTIYVDGVATAGTTVAGNWGTNGTLRIGLGGAANTYWDGVWAECGVATGFTNSTDVANLDLYLKNKWGL